MADPTNPSPEIEADGAPPAYSQHAIHMLRTVQTNTLTLARMADQKASTGATKTYSAGLNCLMSYMIRVPLLRVGGPAAARREPS